MHLRRVRPLLAAGLLAFALQPPPGFAQALERDGPHDFDLESGTWKTHVSRLVKPLTGSTAWVEFELGVATIGAFKDDRGEFHDQEMFAGRAILVRNVWSEISADRCRVEQAFSDDGGRTWEVNWIAVDTRIADPGRG